MDKAGLVNKIPFFLITGFLGSGKTTLLNRVIQQFSSSYRLGIIQNEFAQGNVDGQELKRSGKTFNLLEVNKGSVFCVCLLSSFAHSLSSFINEYQPDMIFLEASGLSDPISIGELLQSKELIDKLYLSYIWTLLDADSFLKIGRTMPRIIHQVRVADSVVINKTDLDSTNLGVIKNWIKDLNPFCRIEEASYCQIELMKELQTPGHEPTAIKRVEEHTVLERGNAPNIGSYVIKTTLPISHKSLQSFLMEVIPDAYRIKGSVKLNTGEMMAVQSSFGRLEMQVLNENMGPTELIGIGPNINAMTFGRRFREYQKLSAVE